MASLSQGRTAAAQFGLFTYKSVPIIFEPPCIIFIMNKSEGKIKNIFAPLPMKQHSVGCLFIFIPVLFCEYITQIYIIPMNGNLCECNWR